MAGGVNIYLYGCVSLLVPEYAVYLCVYVCETHSKVVLVPRLDIYRSIILSEITHQVWHVHPFSQRNTTSKIVGGGGGGEGWKQLKEELDKILKRLGRQYRGIFKT